ncbi:hypothetical protein [Agromyces silvae]|uniref:hypothetical protein n=1 Tax=Agromyces silvae TaxID=3388266 RepID=UPI00280C1AF0|nr:hypothetical protein [Agromyces protaetiae]
MGLHTATSLTAIGVLTLTAVLGPALPSTVIPVNAADDPRAPAAVNASPFDDLPESVVAVELGTPSTSIWATKFRCPFGLPYLWNHDFGLRLNGTRWGTPDSLGTFIPKSTKLTTVNGLVSGWQTATFSAITGGRIYALCTKDPAEAYAPPATSQ